MEIFNLLAEIHVLGKFHRCRLIKLYQLEKDFSSGGLPLLDNLTFQYFNNIENVFLNKYKH